MSPHPDPHPFEGYPLVKVESFYWDNEGEEIVAVFQVREWGVAEPRRGEVRLHAVEATGMIEALRTFETVAVPPAVLDSREPKTAGR